MGTHKYRNRTISFPEDRTLAWFTTNVAPVTGWLVVNKDDPDWVRPMPAWLTQELRPFGSSEVYDTRVVATFVDGYSESHIDVPDHEMSAGLTPVFDDSSVVHESSLDAHLESLRRQAAQ